MQFVFTSKVEVMAISIRLYFQNVLVILTEDVTKVSSSIGIQYSEVKVLLYLNI